MAEQGKVVHKREPNWALLVPIFYAPLFPLMRIALKGNPRLPQYYAIGLGTALAHAAYVMFSDSTVVTRKGFAGNDRDLERACKQCGKKDASTKLKGLEALVARVSDVDATEVRAVAQWLRDARVVELLGFKDDDARVRQGLYDALQACASAGAPLRSVEAALAGPWWAATADACVAASPFRATA